MYTTTILHHAWSWWLPLLCVKDEGCLEILNVMLFILNILH